MKRLIQFFSLAVTTQITLMLSQLLLLPLQVRLWGQRDTAVWYSMLALATITYVVDCGLRTAGHAELTEATRNPSASTGIAQEFSRIWSWIRVLVLAVTGILILGDFAVSRLSQSGSYEAWRGLLILACALETVLTIRITHLDTLGQYRGAEASYFCLAILRLIVAVPALFIFHWHALGLASVYLFTAAIALTAQEQLLCRHIPLLRLSGNFSGLNWRTLALARYTIAEPLANWIRLSLPVLIIAQIAPPVAVTTYVALRAVFGAGRSTVQQFARVASVEFLKSRSTGHPKRAESIVVLFVVAAVFFGTVLGLFVVIDNMRVLGLWLKHFNLELFQQMALAFSLTAPFFSYQIPMNLMFRTGQLAWVAKRHYGFVTYSLLLAGLSLTVRSLPVYLALLVLSEMALSATFFAPGKAKTVLSESRLGETGLRTALSGSLIICCLWLAVRQNMTGIFSALAFGPLAASFILLFVTVTMIGLLVFKIYGSPNLALARQPQTLEPEMALAE